jgi:hypothetical protein
MAHKLHNDSPLGFAIITTVDDLDRKGEAAAVAQKKWKNPFYALLIPAGMAFVVTGFAYGFMAFQMVNAGADAAERYADHPLFTWLRAHGDTAILVELAVLAVLTVGAIGTDSWWTEQDADPKDTPDNS